MSDLILRGGEVADSKGSHLGLKWWKIQGTTRHQFGEHSFTREEAKVIVGKTLAKGSSLTNLESGEGYKLELKAAEVLKLCDCLNELYKIYQKDGIPYGQAEYVRLGLDIR